ncbi:WXG100 family type VII secretion target [Krasilnikovia cinnamomea]|uniref:WXG100 family type VII secretion target n=2 Tax=Krasilnikovia cinnamomea TaxID=349313 RepID=A0A4Q7ZSL2_9ACTN|nr:WXG100 family type VII secretion target [Krasilnikovia cinnamomea]RZU53495.1 WXG100 family type VII secretion target [Krasilnikovia cinnamomea]
MSSYKFNFQVADYTLDGMDAINSKIHEALNNLETYAQSHLAEWTGAAQGSYAEAKVRWDAAADQMNVALAAGRQALFNISDGYGTAEQRATQIWDNTRTGF